MIRLGCAVAGAAIILQVLPAQAQTYTPAEQIKIVHAAADLIEKRYVNADKARKIAITLRQSANRWSVSRTGEAFAKAMTSYMRAASHDGHLGLSYSAKPISEKHGDDDFSATEMTKWYGPQINHGVEKIERLPGNIMLLDLRVFPPADMAGDVIAAAMTVVAQGDALIIDLRKNGGGAETATLMAGYLVKGGSPLSGTYDRPSDTHTYVSSPYWVPGRRFGADKPLYILTSHKTFSAAEAFAYDLQALKRAVIVGETTGGGAHPFEYRRIAPHFAVDLPEESSINPITGTNWEDDGVKPDVPVAADQALSRALELARAAIKKRPQQK